MKNTNTLSAAFIATYPPRKCGIGTFTHDLVQSLKHLSEIGAVREDHLQVIALNNIPEGYDFSSDVNFIIRDQYKGDYREAAEFLNLSGVDVINLQHEYGIFGGEDGNHIIHLLNHLKKPVVTTLHTVLDKPSPGQKTTLQAIASFSTLIVVLAHKAVEILKQVYGIPEKKIVTIPHGAPDVPFLDTSYYKDHFQAEDRRVLLTFGLLSPNKGIEYVLDALPMIIQDFSDVLYIVLGATHPNVKKEQGEQYRIHLERKVKELDLQQHVVFHNRFVSLERLVQFLVATDIYLTPYLSREQISSGTLSYALACGKAIISTPYWYAEELLDDERGILVPFEDSDAIVKNVCTLLSDEVKLNRMRKNAYQWGRQMVWHEVANRYDAVFEQAVNEYGRKKLSVSTRRRAVGYPALPEIKLNHMRLLTDDTGIFQHAVYRTPKRDDGYTTDDNARALMVAAMHFELFHEEYIIELIHTYLSFINHAFNSNKYRFRNQMSYSREWLDEVGSEDSHGRVLWTLGYIIYQAPSHAILSLANQIFKQSLKACEDFSSPRAWAYSILGCFSYLQRFGGDTDTKSMAIQLAQRLSELYERNRQKGWLWFENMVTYANARMPQALIAAGKYMNNTKMMDQGLESLDWLLQVQTASNGKHISLVGNEGWFRKGGRRPRFDQQPLDAYCLMEACNQAYEATGNERWRQEMDRAFSWFLGKNDKNECLYDFRTGGCFDGLQRGGLNMNQGAESTLTWLAALHVMYRIYNKGIVAPLQSDLEEVIQEASNENK